MAKILKNEEPTERMVTEEDVMAMAAYIQHLEGQNKKLIEELREAKAALVATVQQRNSLNGKLQTLMMDRTNVINIQSVPVQTNDDLINPEQYRVMEYKPKAK